MVVDAHEAHRQARALLARQPRLEQAIRAERAAELGLVRMMPAEDTTDPAAFAAALRALPDAPRPSRSRAAAKAGFMALDGQAQIARDVGEWLLAPRQPTTGVS